MEKYHGKNAKNKKKSKVKAVEETVREEIPREEVRVPEEKKELKFDLYEKVSHGPVKTGDTPKEAAPAEPVITPFVSPAAEKPAEPEMPYEPELEEPEFAEPEFDKPEPVSPAAEEPSYPSGISRFPKDETVIPKEEEFKAEPESDVKIEEDINEYRRNIAAIAVPIVGKDADLGIDDTNDITLTAHDDEPVKTEKATDLKAETAEEPVPELPEEEPELSPREARKAEKERLKAEKEQLKADKKKEKEDKKAGKKKVSRTAKTWIISLIVIALVIAFLLIFVFEIVSVEGHSMEPTLNGGEKVIVDKVSRYFEYPERGQIVITKYDGYDGYYIKRVIAYPGEWVEVYDNTIYLNGEPLEEPYSASGEISDMELQQVPEGCYFLVGDNRTQSLDSRQDTIGCVKQENLIGNAWAVIWPFDNIHMIK